MADVVLVEVVEAPDEPLEFTPVEFTPVEFTPVELRPVGVVPVGSPAPVGVGPPVAMFVPPFTPVPPTPEAVPAAPVVPAALEVPVAGIVMPFTMRGAVALFAMPVFVPVFVPVVANVEPFGFVKPFGLLEPGTSPLPVPAFDAAPGTNGGCGRAPTFAAVFVGVGEVPELPKPVVTPCVVVVPGTDGVNVSVGGRFDWVFEATAPVVDVVPLSFAVVDDLLLGADGVEAMK